MSPVATCRAVHVLARSQEAGMDAWEWGSTLMHGCKCEGKHAQQHSTAHEGHIAGRSPQPKTKLEELLALAMSTFSLRGKRTK